MIVTNYNKWKRINEDEEVDLDNFDSIDLDNLDLGDFDFDEFNNDETSNTLGLHNIEDTTITTSNGTKYRLEDWFKEVAAGTQANTGNYRSINSVIDNVDELVKNKLASQEYVDSVNLWVKNIREGVANAKVGKINTLAFMNTYSDNFNKTIKVRDDNTTEVEQYLDDNQPPGTDETVRNLIKSIIVNDARDVVGMTDIDKDVITTISKAAASGTYDVKGWENWPDDMFKSKRNHDRN
jgi:hypothetical protein